MAKYMVDKITISGASVDLTTNVKGLVSIDKKDAPDLTGGQAHILSEEVVFEVDAIDTPGATYNSLRGQINSNVNITFYTGGTTLVLTVTGIRLYPKYLFELGKAPSCNVTGKKEVPTGTLASMGITLGSGV